MINNPNIIEQRKEGETEHSGCAVTMNAGWMSKHNSHQYEQNLTNLNIGE